MNHDCLFGYRYPVIVPPLFASQVSLLCGSDVLREPLKQALVEARLCAIGAAQDNDCR